MEDKNVTTVDPSVLTAQTGENTGIVPPVNPTVGEAEKVVEPKKNGKAAKPKSEAKIIQEDLESDDFAEVFEANPELTEIHVVGTMPFADAATADSFMKSENRLLLKSEHLVVKIIKRGLMLVLLLVSGSLMAQDVPAQLPSTDGGVWDWILMNKGQAMTAILFVLGFLSRLFPTKYSYDILKWLSVLLDAIFGDKKASGGDFKTEVKDV
jgi:hypothetical protein